MKDAFGGTFMIRIMLVFIFLFVFFIAIALSYVKAFRIKNEIIDYLEKNQVVISDKTSFVGKSAMDDGTIRSDIMSITEKYNYGVTCEDVRYSDNKSCISGVIIEPVDVNTKVNGVDYRYYNVYVVINHDLGFLKILLSLTRESDSGDMSGTWTVSGKTKVIVNG